MARPMFAVPGNNGKEWSRELARPGLSVTALPAILIFKKPTIFSNKL